MSNSLSKGISFVFIFLLLFTLPVSGQEKQGLSVSVVVSLWSVSDESTGRLMVEFYRNIKNGVNKVEALRRAKLELIQQQKELGQDREGKRIYLSYGHPFF